MKQNLGELKQIDNDVFEDSRGRTILVDYKKSNSYVVPTIAKKQMMLLKSRYLISVVLAVIIGTYISWLAGISLGLVVFVVIEAYYRKKFLPSLEIIESNDIPTSSNQHIYLASKGKKSNIGRLVAGILLAILLVVNIFVQIKSSGEGLTNINNIWMIIGTIGIICYDVYICVLVIKALVYLSEKEKENVGI